MAFDIISLWELFIHYCSPILSILIAKILDEHYTNPVNIIFDIYFSSSKRKCNDMRCINGIISHNITTFYNNFEFPNFLVFVIDTTDVRTLKDNIKPIKALFNGILVLDSNEYELVA